MPRYKSISSSIYPILFNVNELPKDVRFTKQYTFLAGMYFSISKPEASVVFPALIHQFIQLKKLPHKVKINDEIKEVVPIFFCLICDMIAKADALNLKHPSGYYG